MNFSVPVSFKVDRFWYTYFLIRLFYLFFTVLLFPKLTVFGDPIAYMTVGIPSTIDSSTAFMLFIGGCVGKVLGGFNVLSSFPFMLVSFCILKYTIEKLQIRKYLPDKIVLILLSLPTFCIWTSVCSKETVGLVYSCILGLLLVRYLNGRFKIHFYEWVAMFLCTLFKPQYMPFILSMLGYIYVAYHIPSKAGKLIFSFLYVFLIGWVLYMCRDLIDFYAFGVQHAFDYDSDFSSSTRNTDIFIESYDFFRKAPLGMIMAFWGPTLDEALRKPFHTLVFLESGVLIVCLFYLSGGLLRQIWVEKKLDIVKVTSYFVFFSGILFVHYPFGIFNPGSATRYRNNFLFIFIILLMHLYIYYKEKGKEFYLPKES